MKCPICGNEYDRLLALSRTDNETPICDECGVKQALDTAGFTEGSSTREAVLEAHRKAYNPQARTEAAVRATGNKWAIENFEATHS